MSINVESWRKRIGWYKIARVKMRLKLEKVYAVAANDVYYNFILVSVRKSISRRYCVRELESSPLKSFGKRECNSITVRWTMWRKKVSGTLVIHLILRETVLSIQS